MHYLIFRPVFAENSNVTLSDALDCDIDMILDINQFLDIRDSYLELKLDEQQEEMKRQMRNG